MQTGTHWPNNSVEQALSHTIPDMAHPRKHFQLLPSGCLNPAIVRTIAEFFQDQ